MGQKFGDAGVHRSARLDHQQNLARGFQRGGELFDGAAAGHRLAGAAAGDEIVHFGDGAVVDGGAEVMVRQVQGQVFPHDREADDADDCLIFHD